MGPKVAWQDIFKTQDEGGLGIRALKEVNLVFLWTGPELYPWVNFWAAVFRLPIKCIKDIEQLC